MEPSQLIRQAREAADLTQAELARRLGCSQASVARLERRGTNPTVATLERALRAAGRQLRLSADEPSSVDETLIASYLRMTPRERLKAFESAHNSLARLRKLAGAPEIAG